MPFRQKMKKVFGRSSNGSDSGSSQGSSSKESSVYQPGEAIPASKYRGYVDPKHKARLENFTFASSDWRRQSTNSGYSPMGSKMPSRNNSTFAPHNRFGEVQKGSDEADDALNGGGPRDESLDASKHATEHREYANGPVADDHTASTEADVYRANKAPQAAA